MNDRKSEEEKVIKGAPQNKDRAAREGEEKPEGEPEGDVYGTVHVMEEEMKQGALDKQPGAENAPREPPSVIHVMEAQMKGEAIQQRDRPDNELPDVEEPPLPGKPPEPPLGGGSGKTDEERRDAEEARRNQEQVRRQNEQAKKR
jgi:hypothetical protein